MDEVDPWRGQRETRGLRELRYDGGSLALNLVCTVGRRGSRPIERLAGPGELVAWLSEVGLGGLVAPPAGDGLFLTRLRGLREALYEFLAEVAVGGVASEGCRRVINAHAAVAPPVPLVSGPDARTAGMAVRWVGEPSDDAVLALIARDGIDHLRDEQRRERLSICAAADCRMLYLDTSRSGRRQWCSMRHCGNRVKAANHRARAQAHVVPPRTDCC